MRTFTIRESSDRWIQNVLFFDIQKYVDALRAYMRKDHKEMYRKSSGVLPYAFLTTDSPSYGDALWDWDSYFSNVVYPIT